MNARESRSSEKAEKKQSARNQSAKTSPIAKRPAVPVMQPVTDPMVQKEKLPGNEEPLQGKFIPLQKKQKAPIQLKKRNNSSTTAFNPIQRKENKTGLPDNLKSGVENLSGTNLSDVKVHYGSSQPAQFNALAYAHGTDIHIAPGQEQHLPHEAWHVAQQKQGRVQATTQMKGAGINDDISLEKEADDMGAKAMTTPVDSLASGYEHFNKADIGEVKAQSSLVSTTQRQTFENINNEIADSLRTINHSGNSAVQKQAITQLVAGKFLVDDGEPVNEGQVSKSNFLSVLRGEVQKLAKEILAPVGLAQSNCPDLNYWINYYQQKDAEYFEAAMARYAPATAGAKNPEQYRAGIIAKIKDALVKHIHSGVNEHDPEQVPDEIEEKRADPSILKLQRKEMKPIQLGTAATAAPARDTKVSPQALYHRIQEIREMDEPKRCQATVQLFIDSGMNVINLPDIATESKEDKRSAALAGSIFAMADDAGGDEEKKEVGATLSLRPFTSTPNINHNYRQIWDCAGTQSMVLRRLLGNVLGETKDRAFTATASYMNDRRDIKATSHADGLLNSHPDSITTLMGRIDMGPCVVPMGSASIAGAAGRTHVFTIAGSADSFFLFQGWVDVHSILDRDYTRPMNRAGLIQFFTDLVSRARGGEERKQTQSVERKADYVDALNREQRMDTIAGTQETERRGFFANSTLLTTYTYQVFRIIP